MRHAKKMGWGLIAAAGVVGVFAAGMIFSAATLTLTESALLFVGLLIPLGAQVAFGWLMLRQTHNPND